MRIKWGLIAGWGLGSIGGALCGMNKHSAYMKVKTARKYSGTNYKLPPQYRLTKFGKLWQTLHLFERQQWVDYAKSYEHLDHIGNTVYPSGFNEFIAINSNLELCGLSWIRVPLPRTTANPTCIFHVNVSHANGVILVFTTKPSQTDFIILIKSCTAVKQGQFYNQNKLVIIGQLPSVHLYAVDISALYYSRFPILPAAGLKLFFAIQLCSKTCGNTFNTLVVESIVS
jgi:hypothetical protein